MTYVKDVFGRDLFKDFDRLYVGFDDTYNRMAKIHDDITKTFQTIHLTILRKQVTIPTLLKSQ